MGLRSAFPMVLSVLLAATNPAARANELHQMFADGSVWSARVSNGQDAILRLTANGHGTLSIWPVVQQIEWAAKGNSICLGTGFTNGQCFTLIQVANSFVGTFDDGTKLEFRGSK